jgi:folate-binding protein YgfZ
MDPVIALTAEDSLALATGKLLTLRDDAVFRLEGPGVTECLQGLLTNDVKAGGDHGLVWGAVLTPKGMIISDAWVRRDGTTAAWVIVPRIAREAVRALFQKTLPPRLAKCRDLGDEMTVGWFLCGAPERLEGAEVSQPHGPAPFAAMLLSRDVRGDVQRAEAAGWRLVDGVFGEASKVLLGWPTLGREIDDRTLVQEVRFDELVGVRYDKGCYTGQETVARLHFRGHPNRALRGVTWAAGVEPTSETVTRDGKVVGSLGTVMKLGSRTLALAVLRREVTPGTEVGTGETAAMVVELPFGSGEGMVA